ncbi:MAG: hypothetical protein ABSH48_11590 [Verrucomicrobiota bacterium]|jgi:hypothetical protein
MSFWGVISAVVRIRRILVLVSLVAGGGAGYKYGPAIYHRAEEARASKPAALTGAKSPVDGSVTTNSAGIKLCNRDLGEVSLTNRFETSVSLGKGATCLLTPLMIDNRTVQLTVTVESRNPNGRIHDLAIAQVVTPSGQPFDVAVGDFSFSLTPNVISPQ